MVNHKILGFIFIGIAIFFLISVLIFKIQINNLTDALMIETGGNCIQEGKCLHEQSDTPVYLGIAIIFITFSLGLYLIFFEKSYEYAEKIQKEIVGTLHETKKKQDKNEKFEFLLKALNDDENTFARTSGAGFHNNA